MRIRSIKPEFWSSEDVAALEWCERLVFLGLWSYVDDNGVGRDNEKLIVADLFPLEDDPRETVATVSRALQKLSDRGLVTRYADENGKTYLYITGWSHQRIDKPAKARYPTPTSANVVPREGVARPSRDSRESLAPGTGEQGIREQGTGEQAAQQRGTRIDPDWMPDEDVIEAMKSERPDVDLQLEHRKFVDFWRAKTGKDATKLDWNATWRNWIRNAKGSVRPMRQQHTDDIFARAAAWAAEQEASAS